MVAACTVVILLALGWAVTQSGGDGDPGATDPALTDLAPSTAPGSDSELQRRETWTDLGVSSTVQLVQSFGPPTPSGPDHSWYGVRITRCAGDDALAVAAGASWRVWSVSDGTETYDAVDLTPPDGLVQQVFPTAGVRPGVCRDGWVFWDLPNAAASSIREVVLRQDGEVAATWTVG